MPRAGRRLLDFDIDHYLNPIVPPSWLNRVPQPLAHFLGYRADAPSQPPQLIVWAWSFIGAFAGLALVGGVFRASPWIQSLNPPVIPPAYGAAAILEFNCIESPLAQPRNVIIGQLLSVTVGVCITKLFAYLPTELFQDVRWLVGALNVGAASFLMGLTKTIHPPAGATALVTGTDPGAIAMGWSMIPLVLISDCLTLGSALLINNIQRRFPRYWWTAQERKGSRTSLIESKTGSDPSDLCDDTELGTVARSDSRASNRTLPEIKLTNHGVDIPDWLVLEDSERDLLHDLHGRLRMHNSSAKTGLQSRRASQV